MTNTYSRALIRRLSSMAIAASAVAVGFAPALTRADDTEALFPPANLLTADAPNILFVIDTSATMGSPVALPGDPGAPAPDPYDAGKNYTSEPGAPSDCVADRIYWTATADPLPQSCAGLPYIDADLANRENTSLNKLSCKVLQDFFSSTGNAGFTPFGQVAQYKASSKEWVALAPGQSSWTLECDADKGTHGINTAATNRYIAKKNQGDANGYVSGAQTNRIGTFPNQSYLFISGNRVAYEYLAFGAGNGGGGSGGTASRLDIVKAALAEVMDSVKDVAGVNVGLMRIANNGAQADGKGSTAGGMVVQEIRSLADGGADAIKYTLFDRTAAPEGCALDPLNPDDPDASCRQVMVPGGRKALGETLYEAYQYLSGGTVTWGDQSRITPKINFPSVEASFANPGATGQNLKYKSPITECGRTYLVILSDGLTEQDRSNDQAIAGLPNFRNLPEIANPNSASAKCDEDEVSAGPTGSECVDDLPGYMWVNDIRPGTPGVQNVKTFTIGFDLEGKPGEQVLRDAARRGGGAFFNATNQQQLRDIFTEILRRVLFENAVFTAPAVTVNAFNRTQNLESLFFSVFKPNEFSYRWLGNLKKYRLDPASGLVVDANGAPAVDISKGFFSETARSFWSTEVDGADAAKGGAAGLLDDPPARNIYYNAVDDDDDLAELSSLATATNAEELIYGGPAPASAPTVATLVDWAYGFNAAGAARRDMGDPLHSRPAAVIYGGTATAPETVVFVTTNDGMLHAIDATVDPDSPNAGGEELWAFMPKQMLSRLPDLYANPDVTQRTYGLDGTIRVYRKDVNRDGIIEPDEGDRVYLFLGMRRGGQHYFALDVSNKTTPRLLWRIGESDDDIDEGSSRHLPGIGQTWSTPSIARVNIDRTWPDDNPDKLVLIFGGGFDGAQDDLGWSTQTRGNGIYMVDAVSGELIWRAAGPGPTQSSAALQLDGMLQSVVADVTVADFGNDGFAERMYAADLGGRVWRFDIINGAEPADLVKGGLFASVGLGEITSAPDPDPNLSNRRFYYAPDVSIIECGGRRWINVALGSGNRERPVSDEFTQDTFYSLRDPYLFTVVENDNYKADCTDADPADGACHQIITDDDERLVDVSNDLEPTIPSDSVGWKLRMNFAESEKVLAESRTFESKVLFSSYSPKPIQLTQCSGTFGLNRLYVISACNARAALDTLREGVVDPTQRYLEVPFAGIAPEVVVAFPPCSGPGCRIIPRILLGPVAVGSGQPVRPVRTFWRQNAVQ